MTMSLRARIVLVCVLLALSVSVRADVVSAKVTVTTSATLLASATQVEGRKQVEISHACASSIFVGGSAVTTATGRDLPAGASLSLTLIGGESVYAIYASGTCSTNVLRSGGS